MWSSKVSGKSKILILRYSKTKRIIPFVSYFWYPSTVHISGSKCLISMGVSAKWRFAKSACNQIEKLKMNSIFHQPWMGELHHYYILLILSLLWSLFSGNFGTTSSQIYENAKLSPLGWRPLFLFCPHPLIYDPPFLVKKCQPHPLLPIFRISEQHP